MSFDAELALAKRVADEAAAIALAGWRSGLAIEKKQRVDLITEYDLRAEAHIREALRAAFPDDRFVGEEGEGAWSDADGRVWYVDPIDGTTNFAHGHPFFCTSIALYEGARGLVCAISAPALGVRWWASAGGGAVRAANGEERRCTVSKRDALENALCATGFAYDRWTNPDDNLPEFEAMLKSTRGLRRCGSAALDLCLVADGTYDVYWERRLSPWDFGGGALLVSEAGGTLSDLGGRPHDVRRGELLAANPRLHAAALRTIQAARQAAGRAPE